MSYKRSSFNHTIDKRRSSVVVDNLGRPGLFTPSDFTNLEEQLFHNDDNLIHPITSDPELIREELQLLQQNGVDIPKYGLLILTLDNFDRPDLPQLSTETNAIDETWNDAIKSNKLTKASFTTELFNLINSSIPLIITFTFEYSLSVASVFSVGHLGSTELLAVSLGSMTLNISLYSTIQGMASSLDTLCSQLYGAGNYRMVAVHFQKCTLIIFCCYIPIFIFYWTCGNWALSKLIPDPASALLLSRYLKLVSLGIPGFIFFETGKRFLQCQGIFHASTYILCFCAPLNALMNYLLVWNKYIGIGYIGAPIAILIDFWLMALGLLVYTLKTNNPINPMKCWIPIDWKECFKGWKSLFELALPGVIMIELEFLAFELLTLLLSYLGTQNLALQSIVITLAAMSYQVPYLISVAAGTRVANLLGAALVPMAKLHSQIALVFGLIVSLMNFAILYFGDEKLARLFTNDEITISIVSKILPYVSLIQIFDALNLVSAGLLRGQGLQKIGGIVNLISYYLIGIPTAVLLCFKFSYGLVGLWLGTGLALLIIGVVQSWFVLKADYIELVAELERRNDL